MMHCNEPGCAYKTRTKDGMKNHVEKVHLGIRFVFCCYLDYNALVYYDAKREWILGITIASKVFFSTHLIRCFNFVDYYCVLIGWFIKFHVQMFQPLIYRRDDFV